MSDLAKRVLERSETGEYKFTSYGEFLSYYHAHLQIFNKFITEKPLSQKERDEIYSRIKSYMVSNVKKTDHFFEKINDFSSFLQISADDLKKYMNHNFVEVLNRVQDKLKEQELEKLSSKKDFAHITDELVFKHGEIFPIGHKFVLNDGLLVIQNLQSGEVLKPQGMLSAIKEDQIKEQEKLAARITHHKPKEVEYKEETSILVEIYDLYSDILTGEKLELKEEFIQNTEIEEKKSEPDKEPSDLDEIQDLQYETEPKQESVGLLDDIEAYDAKITSINIPALNSGHTAVNIPAFNSGTTQMNMPALAEPSILDDIEEQYKTKTNVPVYETNPHSDILDLLNTTPTIPVVQEEPDEADKFNYKQFSEITKIIQNYKLANDVAGYNNWMSKASDLEKTFISIRTNLSKEQQGQSFDWSKFYESVEARTKLKKKTVEKLKNKIKHLEITKTYLDISAKNLKNQTAEILNLVKSAWPHIILCFGDAPDYKLVEGKLNTLLAKIKNETQRQPIQKILFQAITKLKEQI